MIDPTTLTSSMPIIRRVATVMKVVPVGVAITRKTMTSLSAVQMRARTVKIAQFVVIINRKNILSTSRMGMKMAPLTMTMGMSAIQFRARAAKITLFLVIIMRRIMMITIQMVVRTVMSTLPGVVTKMRIATTMKVSLRARNMKIVPPVVVIKMRITMSTIRMVVGIVTSALTEVVTKMRIAPTT